MKLEIEEFYSEQEFLDAKNDSIVDGTFIRSWKNRGVWYIEMIKKDKEKIA